MSEETPKQPKERQPWERQLGEGWKAHDAFIAYRDLGLTRSLAAVGQKLGKSTTLMERWSARWNWAERVRLHDDYREAERQRAADQVVLESAIAEAEENEEQRKARIREARRLAQTAEGGLITAAPVALARLHAAQDEVRKLIEGNASPEKVTAAIGDAVSVLNWATKSLDVAHKLEREALGKPGSTVGVVVNLDALAEQITRIIMKRTPEPEWDVVLGEVIAAMKGDRGNGHP